MARTSTAADSTIDRKRINKLTEEQMARFREHTPTSAEYFDRARKVMPGGVPSSFQLNDPWPVYIDRGKGALVWDVDGSEYVDFHNGFGVMCVGHANPVIGEAVKARVDEGTHFAAPTNGSIVSAEEPGRALRTAPVALLELGDRVHDVGDPSRSRCDRARPDHQDRGLLRRPPRRGDGLLLPRARRARPAREPQPDSLRRRLPAGGCRADPPGAIQRPGDPRGNAEEVRGQDRRADHGAGDDEHQHHPAEGRLPRACPGALHRARREAHLRRGEDRRHHLLRRRHRPLRGRAGHDLPRQGDLRRLPGRRDRDDRGARRGGRHGQGAPDRHVQWQSRW